MGIFSRTKEKEGLALVFDIGSHSVGGTLFELEKSGVPRIIYSVREPVIFEAEVSFERLLHLTMNALAKVSSKICLAGLGAPKKTFCILSSPWYASQTRTIKYEKNTPFVFNSKLADSLIEKELEIFKEEHLKQFGAEIEPIEFKSVHTELNGYPTTDPLNQKAQKAEITIFVSMSPTEVLKEFREVVGKHFNSEKMKFSSFVMASFTVVRDLFADKDSFLLIDIGGEVTDISMVKKNLLKESISFPLGHNFIMREMSKSLKCDQNDAKSCIALYKAEHMEDAEKKKVDPIMFKIKTDWLKKFQESLVNISNDISIPANIFLTIDPDWAEFFSDIIRNEQFNQYTLTESKFKITAIDTKVLHGLATFEESVIRDPFLIIESVYINRYLG